MKLEHYHEDLFLRIIVEDKKSEDNYTEEEVEQEEQVDEKVEEVEEKDDEILVKELLFGNFV